MTIASSIVKNRRALLPLWIKIFLWIFGVFSLFVPVLLISSLLGYESPIALYGLETNESFSLLGLLLMGLFILKGAVSFGLWMGKDWGPNLAKADAIIGIALCVFSMLILPFIADGVGIVIRLELIALIPYLLVMNKIIPDWKVGGSEELAQDLIEQIGKE